MPAIITVRCDHTLISTSFGDFPCQLNLSDILVSYPTIKAMITGASDINVFSVSAASYVDVYIDLQLANDKLLVYFSGAIDDISDKTFKVMIGYTASSNTYSVFSAYYDRFWGLNAPTNTATTDVCLATGNVLSKNTATFAYDALFYKGARGNILGGYATSPSIPSLVNVQKFTFEVKFEKRDTSSTGHSQFFVSYPSSNYYIIVDHSNLNRLRMQISNGSGTRIEAYVDTTTWVINQFYDAKFVVDLSQSTYTDKIKLYVDGSIEALTFGAFGTGLTHTHSSTNSVQFLGYLTTQEICIVDSIGIMDDIIDADYILTDANQYLDSDFWTITDVDDNPSAGNFGLSVTRTFVNHRIRFTPFVSGTTYTWYFGDGGMSTKENPWHTYTKAGVYTITLIADGVENVLIDAITVFESSFILDAGAVYLNYGERNQMILGATEGGNLFGIDQDFRHMSFDTLNNSELAGSHRLTNSVPKIIANFIEINYRLLNIAMPGSDITFNSGATMINRAIRKLLNNDYVKNIAIVAEHGGTGCYIVFKILNAITVENLEIPFEDSNESVIEVTFAGCFSETNYDDEPWQIDVITKS